MSAKATSASQIEDPLKFYKYRSVSEQNRAFVERLIVHNEVYFPPASSFNDPFDLRPVFSLDAPPQVQREDFMRLSRKHNAHLSDAEREAMADKVMNTSLSNDGIETTRMMIQAIHNEFIRTNIGVYCVSESWSNILMWSHYADDHRGICIEFEATGTLLQTAQRVIYSKDRLPINLYDGDKVAMAERSLLTKSSDWAYEREWRRLDYECGPGLVRFQETDMSQIIIGANASSDVVQALKTWNKARAKPVPLMRADLSTTHYELKLRPLR
jgi:hypothetical protein